jgi:hemerythrin-like domain-containing protein
MAPSASQHGEFLHSLALVHRALRRSIDTIVRVSTRPIPESDRAGFADFTERFTKFLHTHHDGEEEVIFPALRAAGERASMPEQVSHVVSWRADHEKLLVRLRELEERCSAFRAGGSPEALAKAAVEVRELLLSHLDSEEAALNESVLQKLMTGEQAASLSEAASKHGQRHGGGAVMMTYLHELTPEEQTHFSTLPWFVRRVLMQWVWSRGFRGCLKYAHSPSIAL